MTETLQTGLATPPTRDRSARVWIFALVAVAGTLLAFLLPPLAQVQSYHRFADERAALGLPNFLDVVSNAAFLVVGLGGLVWLFRQRAGQRQEGCLAPAERLAYGMFFLGIWLTGLGSGYYHWQPNDATLIWDRMPLTLAFMSMLAAGIAERVSPQAGQWLLGPLALAGMGSVLYWKYTGNLWPYAAAQYFSILLLALLLLLFPARYTRTQDLVWVMAAYGLAKLAEALDGPILALTRLISGHTLKHLIAAAAVWLLLRMLVERTSRASPGSLTAIDGRAETIAAFHRKFREGAIGSKDLNTLLRQFEQECRAGAFRWLALSETVVARLAKVYASLPAAVVLRAADALHLTCATEHSLKALYSNDARLLACAA